MAKQSFSSGQTLTAQQMNDLQTNDFNLSVSTQTANYTLQAADKGTREVMNMGAAGTVTVPNSTFNAGDAVWVHSIGSGTISLVAGTGLTLNSSAGTAPTLAQWEGGVVYFTSASAAIFFRGGSKSTLNVDFLLVGGGAAGGSFVAAGGGAGGGGGGGGYVTGSGIIGKTTYTVKVGAGGSQVVGQSGRNGTASAFLNTANGGGGGGYQGQRGQVGGSGGGGGGGSSSGGTSVSGEGNNGGTGGTTSGGGGGGNTAVGSNGSSGTGGAGGAGTTSSTYDGVSRNYSAGGGGGGSTAGGAAGGASAGAGSKTSPGAGAANQGGGGGGGEDTGANGGSGRVIIRYLTADAAGLTISATGTYSTGTTGSYTYYDFTATGTLVVA